MNIYHILMPVGIYYCPYAHIGLRSKVNFPKSLTNTGKLLMVNDREFGLFEYTPLGKMDEKEAKSILSVPLVSIACPWPPPEGRQ